MYNRKTRYRFYSPTQGRPVFRLEDGGDQQKQPVQDPDNKSADAGDAGDDDLQNVDKSKGGYGGGSGFAPDRS